MTTVPERSQTQISTAERLPPPADGPAGLPPFTPPPRFGEVDFEGFEARHPSQAEARARVAAFAEGAGRARRRWPWQRERRATGLYLDGGFGVGKTHLLAAAWHAAPLPPERKRYLSFQELVYLLGLGRAEASAAFDGVALVCLDEFELDDPGNTLMVKRFLSELFVHGADVVTTSNTPPAAQGEGRFNAEDFRREIQSIAERFEVLHVDGPDRRVAAATARWSSPEALRAATHAAPGPVVRIRWQALLAELARWHPIRYRGLLAGVGTLLVDEARPLASLNDALRFVHFLDKAYDLRVGLRATGAVPVPELFDASIRGGAFEKKFDRCLSRLAEMLHEPLA